MTNMWYGPFHDVGYGDRITFVYKRNDQAECRMGARGDDGAPHQPGALVFFRYGVPGEAHQRYTLMRDGVTVIDSHDRLVVKAVADVEFAKPRLPYREWLRSIGYRR